MSPNTDVFSFKQRKKTGNQRSAGFSQTTDLTEVSWVFGRLSPNTNPKIHSCTAPPMFDAIHAPSNCCLDCLDWQPNQKMPLVSMWFPGSERHNSNHLPHVSLVDGTTRTVWRREEPVWKATSFLGPPTRRSAADRERSGAALSEAGTVRTPFMLLCT